MPCPELVQDSHFRKIGLGGGRPGARRQPRRILFFMDLDFNYQRLGDGGDQGRVRNAILLSPSSSPTMVGVSGHCERGQKMIIKVLEPASPPQSADQNEQKYDAAVAMAAITSATLMSCIMSNLWGSFSSNCTRILRFRSESRVGYAMIRVVNQSLMHGHVYPTFWTRVGYSY
ncbi:unnamed protein product [Prunus armeniaca]